MSSPKTLRDHQGDGPVYNMGLPHFILDLSSTEGCPRQHAQCEHATEYPAPPSRTEPNQTSPRWHQVLTIVTSFFTALFIERASCSFFIVNMLAYLPTLPFELWWHLTDQRVFIPNYFPSPFSTATLLLLSRLFAAHGAIYYGQTMFSVSFFPLFFLFLFYSYSLLLSFHFTLSFPFCHSHSQPLSFLSCFGVLYTPWLCNIFLFYFCLPATRSPLSSCDNSVDSERRTTVYQFYP